VRYVLVARSSAGAESVTFEGIRCDARAYRIYAVGRSDRTWGGRPGEWRAIQANSVQRWHHALRREFFCPFGKAIATREEGVDALLRGGHPSSRPGGWSDVYNR
jgi:hypothetical protein